MAAAGSGDGGRKVLEPMSLNGSTVVDTCLAVGKAAA
jgi:hypothetical protein